MSNIIDTNFTYMGRACKTVVEALGWTIIPGVSERLRYKYDDNTKLLIRSNSDEIRTRTTEDALVNIVEATRLIVGLA